MKILVLNCGSSTVKYQLFEMINEKMFIRGKIDAIGTPEAIFEYQIESKETKKCNGAKCTYKCNSTYSNAISYLDKELKPVEGFGNLYDNYESFY